MGSDGSFVGRPVAVYEAECRKHGFELIECEYLGLRFSRTAHELVRRLLVPARHREGEPYGFLPNAVLNGLLFFTRPLDNAVPDNRELTKMPSREDSWPRVRPISGCAGPRVREAHRR